MSFPPLKTTFNHKLITVRSRFKSNMTTIQQKPKIKGKLTTICTAIFLVLITANPALANPDGRRWLQVGIIQRFGEEKTDKLTLKATPEDKLTLHFKTMEGEGSLKVDSVTLQIKTQPLEKPLLRDRKSVV